MFEWEGITGFTITQRTRCIRLWLFTLIKEFRHFSGSKGKGKTLVEGQTVNCDVFTRADYRYPFVEWEGITRFNNTLRTLCVRL